MPAAVATTIMITRHKAMITKITIMTMATAILIVEPEAMSMLIRDTATTHMGTRRPLPVSMDTIMGRTSDHGGNLQRAD